MKDTIKFSVVVFMITLAAPLAELGMTAAGL